MNDVELILRFFSLYGNKYSDYNAPMREWLNSAMKENIEGLSNLDEFKSLFDRTVEKIDSEFGVNVFKGKGRSFNRAIFDAIMVSIAKGVVEDNFQEDLYEKYKSLLNDEDFKESIVQGTTDPRKVKTRIDRAIEYFLR